MPVHDQRSPRRTGTQRGPILLATMAALVASALGAAGPAAMAAAASRSAAAAGAPASWISVYGSIGGLAHPGAHQVLQASPTTQITATGSPSDIVISATDPTAGSFGLQLQPAAGGELTDGYYPNAQLTPTATDPGEAFTVSGQCYELTEEFEIEDVAFSNGTLTRLDVTFDASCQGGGTPLEVPIAGEISINEPLPGPALVQSETLLLPAQYPGVANMPIDLSLTNPGPVPVPVGPAVASGPGGADVAVDSDTCPLLLGPGTTCVITITVTPQGTGRRQALLSIPTGASSTDVAVHDAGIAGNGAFTLDSPPGEWVGEGLQSTYTQFNSTLYGTGTGASVGFTIESSGVGYGAVIVAPVGQTLTPGTYTNVARNRYQTADQFGLDISGLSRDCLAVSGQITIDDVGFYPDGRLSRFAADIQQVCDSGPALYVGIRYASSVPYAAVGIDPDPGNGALDLSLTVPGNVSSTRTVTVIDAGVTSMPVSATLTGADLASFSITASSCTGTTQLNPRSSCQVSVRFAPATTAALGMHTANLVFADGTLRGQHVVTLTGEAVAAPTFGYPVNGQTVYDPTQPVTWVTAAGAQGNYLIIGTTPGGMDIVNSGMLPGTQLSYPLPVVVPFGPLYATIFTELNGHWSNYQSIVFYDSPPAGALTNPSFGGLPVDPTLPFTWTTKYQDQAYDLVVGTAPRTANLFNSGVMPGTQGSHAIPALPADTPLYATLISEVDGVWRYYDEAEFIVESPLARFINPVSNQQMTSPTVTFTWSSAPDAQAYYLVVGDQPGIDNEVNSGIVSPTQHSYTATLPPIASYATIFSEAGGTWTHFQTIFFFP